MSVRLPSVLALVLAAAVTSGCATVSADKYHRDLDAANRYISELERQNQSLINENQGLNQKVDDTLVAKTADEYYSQIAKQLQAALEGLRAGDTSGIMHYNKKTGAWEMGTDLLFDSGSEKVSAKGRDILKKFAAAHKDRNINFRIVGHTDRARIARQDTMKRLDTDTNMELSALRAIAVMGALKEFGIPESSFAECVGKGNSQPIAPNNNVAANMKKNRRVEIYILQAPGAMQTSSPKRDTKTK
jgi:chemotaxis protein MotB